MSIWRKYACILATVLIGDTAAYGKSSFKAGDENQPPCLCLQGTNIYHPATNSTISLSAATSRMSSETPFPVAHAKPDYTEVIGNFSEADIGKVLIAMGVGAPLGSWAGTFSFLPA